VRYAEKQVLYDKSRLLQPIVREIALSRQFANSQEIRNWARKPDDPELFRRAIAEMESFPAEFRRSQLFHRAAGIRPLLPQQRQGRVRRQAVSLHAVAEEAGRPLVLRHRAAAARHPHQRQSRCQSRRHQTLDRRADARWEIAFSASPVPASI
jgi:hypothetical protein